MVGQWLIGPRFEYYRHPFSAILNLLGVSTLRKEEQLTNVVQKLALAVLSEKDWNKHSMGREKI